jgi:Fe2+ transport system protein FeoA
MFMNLSANHKGHKVQVIGVKFNNKHFVHKINNIGINKDAIIEVLNYHDTERVLHLLVYGVEYVLRTKDCRYINVREYKDTKQFQTK